MEEIKMYMVRAIDTRDNQTVVYVFEDNELKDAKQLAFSMMSDNYIHVEVSHIGTLKVSNNIYRIEGRNRSFIKFYDE